MFGLAGTGGQGDPLWPGPAIILFAREDEGREVNHHGSLLPTTGITEVEDLEDRGRKELEGQERLEVLFKPAHRKVELISRNEKIHVEVRKYLERFDSSPTLLHLYHLLGGSSTVLSGPLLIFSFNLVYVFYSRIFWFSTLT